MYGVAASSSPSGLSLEKIAACGSSYRGMWTPVGAAAGCDLFYLTSNRMMISVSLHHVRL
ncbi:hypothetical protein EMIT0P258_80060 [Pseudomonas sp. IT-P258]